MSNIYEYGKIQNLLISKFQSAAYNEGYVHLKKKYHLIEMQSEINEHPITVSSLYNIHSI